MPLARMDASWRRRYVEQVTGSGGGGACVFCELADGPMDPSTGVVDLNETCFVVLNAYPYGSGHVLVLPRRHVGRLDELDEREAPQLWITALRALRAIELAYAPDAANLGANLGRAAGAGIPDHVHLHALPRWEGDTNFMTAVTETRVLPEALEASFAKLREAFAAL